MTARPLPFPRVGFLSPSVGELKHWREMSGGFVLSQDEIAALRQEWFDAMRAAGYVQVWTDLSTGEIAAKDAPK